MPDGKPNILVIWGDDIGITNLSCYSHGVMGYRTPNIDRIAAEGMMFTDSYGEQSCTAGRSSFITGQSVYRTGLSKVGIPGAPVGLHAEDPTIAELLKPLGYATGQFGKNHLGDLNEYLPDRPRLRRVLRQPLPPQRRGGAGAPELPADRRVPAVPRAASGPRGVLHCWATEDDDADRAAPLGPGRQAAHRGHRPADEEADGDDRRRHRRPRPRLPRPPARRRHAVLRVGQHDPHALLHAPEAREHRPGRAVAVGVPRHDDRPRQATSGCCSTSSTSSASPTTRSSCTRTDNGPHMNTWPDAGMTPFRSEKNTNWEGAFRVPEVIRWPGHIAGRRRCPTRSSSTTTGCRRSSPPPATTTVVEDLKAGRTIGDTTFKVHIDGYNLLPYLTGEVEKSPRQGMVYFSDDGDVLGLRFDNWKLVFMEQRVPGHAAGLGRAVHPAAGPEDLQPAHRSRSSGPTSRRTRTGSG